MRVLNKIIKLGFYNKIVLMKKLMETSCINLMFDEATSLTLNNSQFKCLYSQGP